MSFIGGGNYTLIDSFDTSYNKSDISKKINDNLNFFFATIIRNDIHTELMSCEKMLASIQSFSLNVKVEPNNFSMLILC